MTQLIHRIFCEIIEKYEFSFTFKLLSHWPEGLAIILVHADWIVLSIYLVIMILQTLS